MREIAHWRRTFLSKWCFRGNHADLRQIRRIVCPNLCCIPCGTRQRVTRGFWRTPVAYVSFYVLKLLWFQRRPLDIGRLPNYTVVVGVVPPETSSAGPKSVHGNDRGRNALRSGGSFTSIARTPKGKSGQSSNSAAQRL